MFRLLRPSTAAILVSSILCALAPVAAFAGTPVSAAAEPAPIDVDGARLLVLDSDSDQGSIFAVMLAGVGNQRPGETHLAHATEHVVFRNPGADGTNLAQYASGFGGVYNGWTGPDHTQFELTVPNAEIPAALERLVRSLFCDTVNAAALRTEIDSRLTSELSFMTSNQLSAPLNAGQMAMFSGTRYYEDRFSVPVASVTGDAVLAFKSREYCPARLLVVVCAKVDANAVRDALARSLADIPPGAAPLASPVSLTPVSESLSVAGSLSPRVMTGLVFNDVKTEDAAVAHALCLLIAQRAMQGGASGLKPVQQLFALADLDGAAGLSLGFTRSGLGIFLGQEKMEAAAALALNIAWESVRDQGPTAEELDGLVGGWGQQGMGSYPDTVPPSLITAFNAGMRYVPGTGAVLQQMAEPISREQLAEDLRAFLASHPASQPYTVFLKGQSYLRAMMIRVGLGLIIAVAAGIAIASLIVRRRRASRSVPDMQ